MLFKIPKTKQLIPHFEFSVYNFCPVCGDVTSGLHYGARTCESCKLFFKRTIQLQRENSYTCSGRMQCVVNVQTRAWCKLCRFNKCLSSGMKVGMVHKIKNRLLPMYNFWIKFYTILPGADIYFIFDDNNRYTSILPKWWLPTPPKN